MTQSLISPDDKFVHVQDSFRWLAAADCSWQLRKQWHKLESDPNSLQGLTDSERNVVTGILRNADVSFVSSALTYARGLIDFFSNNRQRPTDIVADDFKIVLPPTVGAELTYLRDTVKFAIDRHLAHLTDFRDPQHPDRATHDRLDWNIELTPIVDRLVTLLRAVVAQPSSPDSLAKFELLLEAVEKRRTNPSYEWPAAITP